MPETPSVESAATRGRHAGHVTAITATAFLLVDFVVLVALGGGVAGRLMQGSDVVSIVRDTPLPIGIYVAWGLGIFGTVFAILAIFLYGFRERWFWRCLVAAAIAWLIFPPVLSVAGVISLVLLLRFRSAFPIRQNASEPPP